MHWISAIRTLALRQVTKMFLGLAAWLDCRERDKLVRLGSAYGGWWVPQGARGVEVVYSIGAGEDISFDLEMWRRGATVRVMDPTPRAVEYVRQHAPASSRFLFIPAGLWSRSGTLKLYPPANPLHVSYSAIRSGSSGVAIEVPVLSLSDAMSHAGDAHIDLLKMDIEGAEVEVIKDLLSVSAMPTWLCVEFDTPDHPWTVFSLIRRLRRSGYFVQRVEKLNVTLRLGPKGQER